MAEKKQMHFSYDQKHVNCLNFLIKKLKSQS